MSLRLPYVDVVLTDIEGTTTPISFVKDRLFPFARERLAFFLATHVQEPDVMRVLEDAAALSGHPSADLDALTSAFTAWMDEDAKVRPLKDVQGLIWQDGYRTGALTGDIYDDAADGLRAWAGQGIRLAVYSSGSVLAQKLLFGHTRFGDLTPLFAGFFDTAVGPKRSADSYRRIAAALGVEEGAMLFLSDVVEELDAAAAAGMTTVQVVRPQDGTVAGTRHPVASSFLDITIGASAVEKSA